MMFIFSIVGHKMLANGSDEISHCVGYGDYDNKEDARQDISDESKMIYKKEDDYYRWSISLAEFSDTVVQDDH